MSVILKDLNDFIEPSTECIKIPQTNPPNNSTEVYKEDQKPISITLSDCLACSGCITTSETLLISRQTAQEFLDHSQNPTYHSVVTVSPQSLVAIASHFSLSLTEATSMLVGFLKQHCQVKAVFDSSLGRNLSLILGAEEFQQRYENQPESLPLISSCCPGWICFVEKSQPALIPHLSQVKSPQQTNGYLVKFLYSKWANISNPQVIYHTSIMPCADKKLEASRPDFTHSLAVEKQNDSFKFAELDCVLTTNEIILLMQKFNWPLKSDNLEALEGSNPSPKLLEYDSFLNRYPPFISHYGSGSGGYLENILIEFVNNRKTIIINDHSSQKAPIKKLNAQSFSQEVTVRQVRGNPDFLEYIFSIDDEGDDDEKSSSSEGKIIKFASVYGFRNIQNITRQIKAKKCPYAYVEIMACPSGCLNGGGQPALPKDQASNAMQALKELYASIPIQTPMMIIEGEGENPKMTSFLHAKWHAVQEQPTTKW